MGCSNAKMVQVAPQAGPLDAKQPLPDIIDRKKNNNNNKLSTDLNSGSRAVSATSKISKRSEDSAFIEGDNDSLKSESGTSRIRSGGLKRTLRNLSAKSDKPREKEEDILTKLRSEGLLATDTQQAKSGLAFELVQESSQPRKLPPARLAKLEKRQKRRKLLTQQDIEAKLAKAEQRRKEAEAERLEKIHSVTVKSDVNSALDSFVAHQKQVKEQVQEKVDSATENRTKKLKELREKLKAKEEHAAMVRQRKKLAKVNQENTDNTEESPKQTAES